MTASATLPACVPSAPDPVETLGPSTQAPLIKTRPTGQSGACRQQVTFSTTCSRLPAPHVHSRILRRRYEVVDQRSSFSTSTTSANQFHLRRQLADPARLQESERTAATKAQTYT